MSRTKCTKLKSKILNGRMLAIDPTSGAINSVTGRYSTAGWAEFENGQLRESGIIEIAESKEKEERFRSLLHVLQAEFDAPYDVLVLEDIPMARRRGTFHISQTLIQACGIYAAAIDGALIEINSHTWQAIARRLGGWTKTDESDAQYIGISAIAFAEGYTQKTSDKRKLEKLGEIVTKYNGWDLEQLQANWSLI